MATRIPRELSENILNTRTDVSKQLQFPIAVVVKDLSPKNYTLTQSVVYRLAPPADDPYKRGRSWLIKVKEGDSDETHHMLHPLSQLIARNLPESFPEALFNLFEFRVFELTKVYTLEGFWSPFYKVAMSLSLDSPVMMMVSNTGTLYHGKSAVVDDKKCIEVSRLDCGVQFVNRNFQDVIFHEGKFYAVCEDGRTVAVDSSRNNIMIASPIPACSGPNHKKYLVESSGELLLVDRCPAYNSLRDINLRFMVFKLNADEKRWFRLEMDALEDRILVLGEDNCFSVSTQDFPGCRGNSIYFSDRHSNKGYYLGNNDTTTFSKTGVFHLNFHIHLPLTYYSSFDNIFCPPPTWIWPTDAERSDSRELV